MSEGYIKIQRELLTHPSFIAAPLAQRWVLIVLIERCAFKPTQMDDNGKIINLKPGQFMCSIRKLAEYAGVGRKDAEHAIDRFSKVKILGQEVGHRKNIYTILWGIEFNDNGTTIGTKVGQEWDINEETKERNSSFSSLKKETIKKEKIVRPPFRSSLLHQEDINAMVAMTKLKNRSVPEKDFSLWLKTISLDEVAWACEKMLEAKSIKKTPAATIQWFLTEGIFRKEKCLENNKLFAEILKKKHNIKSLVITKQYARDENTGYDFQFWWECEMFERTILGVLGLENINEA